jgi:prepilin-type N-terminal cleavage/methylation domain-containing protein
MKKNTNESGFIPHRFLLNAVEERQDLGRKNKVIKYRQSEKSGEGFTLIEILVVVAIISLLSSIALIGLKSAREKSRNVKRLADMTQMNTGLELYNAQNKGYPDSVNGIPQGMTPSFATMLPTSPMPADGLCDQLTNPAGVAANTYYYAPTGTSAVVNGITVYPDYAYYFCLGAQTGNFQSGVRTLTPRGVR